MKLGNFLEHEDSNVVSSGARMSIGIWMDCNVTSSSALGLKGYGDGAAKMMIGTTSLKLSAQDHLKVLILARMISQTKVHATIHNWCCNICGVMGQKVSMRLP